MRLMDVVLAFPSLLLAIAIVTALGQSLLNALLAIGVVSIPIYARVVRSSILSTRENDYVTPRRRSGNRLVLMRRIMPNSLTPLVVGARRMAAALEIAALTFVGVTGSQIPRLDDRARAQPAVRAAHHLPGPRDHLTVLGFNLLGDGLRDALDPRPTDDQARSPVAAQRTLRPARPQAGRDDRRELVPAAARPARRERGGRPCSR
jgi:peptide/nickel transport system permease protein